MRHLDRRAFAAGGLRTAAGVAVAAGASGCRTLGSGSSATLALDAGGDEFDYIVVGSGAGGGVVAANLARGGVRVLVLEAGEADDEAHAEFAAPALHPMSTEDQRLSWNYYVEHWQQQPERDSKFVPGRGIWYPRASTIGGCTAHHAMITVYPFNSDFELIAEATGDASWDPVRMRGYFMRLENCSYLDDEERRRGSHGKDGWLTTSQANLDLLLGDSKLMAIVSAAATQEGSFHDVVSGRLDPNDWSVVRNRRQGVYNIPIATKDGKRAGVREFLLATQAANPERLSIRTNALATKVLFDANKRAVGVEYMEGRALYRADPLNGSGGTRKIARARKEVIICTGAFNTPQLLKLSGVGPAAELGQFNIPVVMDLPGVGENLQDRYEIAAVSKMGSPFALLDGCTLGLGDDPCLNAWRTGGASAVYSCSGGVISIVKKSDPELREPDLFMFGLPGLFRGYYPGYSAEIRDSKDYFSWCVLKAKTRSRGRVSLRSADPRDTPRIQFNYFEESGAEGADDDLRALEQGLITVRNVMGGHIRTEFLSDEVWPGGGVRSRQRIFDWCRKEAWGHHASCTAKMGRREEDPMAVLDSRFRVHGVKGLRVVDASIFPRIPGFFIVLPIYIAAEKASDLILEDFGA